MVGGLTLIFFSRTCHCLTHAWSTQNSIVLTIFSSFFLWSSPLSLVRHPLSILLVVVDFTAERQMRIVFFNFQNPTQEIILLCSCSDMITVLLLLLRSSSDYFTPLRPHVTLGHPPRRRGFFVYSLFIGVARAIHTQQRVWTVINSIAFSRKSWKFHKLTEHAAGLTTIL